MTSNLVTLKSLNVDVAGQKDCAFVTDRRNTLDTLPVNSGVVCSFCRRVATKERRKS